MRKRTPIPKKVNSTVNTLVIKCYDEQTPNGLNQILEVIRNISPDEVEIYAIIHGKSKTKKRHIHICMRMTNGKSEKVVTFLNMLGIKFREGIDDKLIENRGLETAGSFTGYFFYLTHRDRNSKRLKKEEYAPSDFVTNLPKERFEELLVQKIPTKKLTAQEIHKKICGAAFQAGYEMIGFDEFFDSNNFIGIPRTKMNEMKIHYRKGLEKKADEIGLIPRLALFIKNREGFSKTAIVSEDVLITASNNVLSNKKTVFIKDLEDLSLISSDTEAIVIAYNVFGRFSKEIQLNLLKNKAEILGLKENIFTIWKGNVIVIYHNDTVHELAKYCYECIVKENNDEKNLYCFSPCKIGDKMMQEERKSMYKDFRDKFNVEIKQIPQDYRIDEEIDYSDIND